MIKRSYVVVVLAATVAVSFWVMTGALAQGDGAPYNPKIDPADFVQGVDIPFFPLVPGTKYVYEGESEDAVEHIEVYVMHETREVMGIECVIVRDTVWEDGELVEDTFDWYAQDNDGNVWYMGENSTEYEDGEAVSKAGSWEAGVDGAKPGIIMWAEPTLDEPYYQEFYAGEAEDQAEVIDLAGEATVAFGDYTDLLVTREWTALEPGIAEHKYYAAGIGLVLEEKVEGGEGRIELVDIVTGLEDEDVDPLAMEYETLSEED